VRPFEQAFVRLVLRHAVLQHGPAHGSPERRRLAMVLHDPQGSPSRRVWRRLAVDLEATVRRSDVQAPATVIDIGGGGLRLLDPNGLARIRGSRRVVSLRTDAGSRIDVPCEVVHSSADGTVGMRFCGAPLVMYERRAA